MKSIYLFLVLLVLIILSGLTTALVQYVMSNESIQAKEKADEAKSCLEEIQNRQIPVARANESYQEAIQLYSAQTALEEKGKKANYALVLEYALEVCNVKEVSLEAQDELKIFAQTFEEAKKDSNLSAMETDYEQILQSFNDERFEETVQLINRGYEKMSEIQASQTTLKLFYDATKANIKTFFIENWKKLSISGGIILFLLFIFWKTIKKIKIKLKIKNLIRQKQALNLLIKNIQYSYFEKKNLSESEFKVKLERFKEMIRDIDRQIPLLKEEVILLDKEKFAKLPKVL